MTRIVFRSTTRYAIRAALRVAPLALFALVLGGCATFDKYAPTWRSLGVYKIDINQGNYLSQDMVDRLKVGMTQQQVRQILGTPLVESPFRPDRWDYVYWREAPNGKREERRVALFFSEDNKLERITGDVVSSAAGR